MDLNQKAHSLKYLGSISDDSTQLGTKITLLSLPSTKRLQFIEAIILVLEYLQIISQTLLLYPDLYQDNNLSTWPFFNGVVYAAKLLSPGYLINFTTENKACIVVVSLLATFTFCKFALYAYTVMILLKGKTGSNTLINSWKCLFHSQARVIYYVASSFWLNAILAAYSTEFKVFGKLSKSSSTVAFCSTFAILEVLFSFFIMIAHCCLLPTKNWLSAKDIQTEFTTLGQKFIIQLIQIFSEINSLNADWVLIIINLLFSGRRTFHFFRNFPLYNLKALFLKGSLIAGVTAFYIAAFFQRIIQAGGQLVGDFRLLFVLGTILGLISVIVVINYLNNVIFELVTSNKPRSPKIIVLKMNAIKYMRTLCKTPSSFTEKYDFEYLLSAAINTRAKHIFNISNSENDFLNIDCENKDSINRIFANLLEEVLIKFPKSFWIKLYAAYFYATKLRFYGKAMKLIGEIRQSRNFVINFNTSIILSQVQNAREKEFGNNEDTLNLHLYISSLSQVAKLKLRMIQQADLQSKLHQEMIEEYPNLAKLFNTGQEIDACKKKINTGAKRIAHTIPDYFITPYILLAHYQYELNHNPEGYRDLMKIYSSKRAKYDKFFKTDDLIAQTLYLPNTCLLAISSQKADVGKICYTNKATCDMLGGDSKYFVGKHIYDVAAMPSTRSFFAAFFKSMAETGNKDLLGKTIRELIIHADGHAVECDYYMNFQPFMSQGSSLNLIAREIFSNKEYIIVLENGDIEISTKKIGEKLGINKAGKSNSKSFHNIKQISEELGRANEAYNIIANPEKYKSNEPSLPIELKSDNNPQYQKNKTMPFVAMDKAEAEVLYNLYTSEGNALSLLSLKTELCGGGSYVGGVGSFQISSETHKYHCKMYNMPYGAFLLKKIVLEEIKEGTKEKLDTRNALSNQNEKPNINFNLLSARVRETEEDDPEFSEKKQGWIDFKGLQSQEVTTRRDSERGNLISPRPSFLDMQPTREDCPQSAGLSSTRNLLTTTPGAPCGLFEMETSPKLQPQYAKISPKSKTTETTNQAQQPHAKFFVKEHRPTESIADSQLSGKSNNGKFSRAYKNAVTSKYYSRSFRILAAIFYIVLISIFACQIALNNILADTKGSLRIKKNILTYAQLRTFHLANVQANFRMVWDLGTGRTQVSELGVVGRPATVYMNIMATYIPILIDVNSKLLKNVDSLSGSIRESLFKKDVRVYNVDIDPSGKSYDWMTAFQGTERVIDTAIKGLALARINVNKSLDQYSFILRNALNDIFLKNDEISTIFLESAIDQIHSIRNKVTGFVIAVIILMVSITFIVFYISLRQYIHEVKNMNAFVRLNTPDIKQIMIQIKNFKADLEEEGSFEDIDKATSHEVRKHLRAGLNVKPQIITKEYSKTTHSSGIAQKYSLYAGMWLVLLAVFIGLCSYNVNYNYNSLENLKTKQIQLDFVNHVNTRINIAMCTAQELPLGNGTTLIKNVPNSEGIFDVIADLKLLQTQFSEIIIQSDLMNNPQIKQVVLVDGCEYYEASIQSYCKVLNNKGVQNSFVELLVSLENFVKIREQQFEDSNKTAASLKAVGLKNYDYLVSIKRVLSGGSTLIASIIDKDFEEYMEETRIKEKQFAKYFYYLGAAIVVLSWILIFNRLDESENRFKKVLQTMPAKVVLSSFQLKTYLMKSSKGLINSVKRDN